MPAVLLQKSPGARSLTAFYLPATWALALLMAAPATRGEQQRIVLREYVHRQWSNELISYAFHAAEGTCREHSLRLDGPAGPLPVQLSDVEHWPGTEWVRSARLWLVANLPAGGENVYTVQYAAEAAAGEAPRGDLTVAAQAEQVQMTTSRFGARLRLGGEDYDPPRPAAEVPGPLAALRLADGTWFGGSRMFGDQRITGWSGELVAAGPVVGRVDYLYRYEDGNAVRLTAVLHEAAAGVTWQAEVAKDRPEDGFELILSTGLEPLTLILQPEAYVDRPQLEPAGAASRREDGWVEIALADYEGEVVTRLSPWADWWNTWTQTSIRLRIGDTPRELHVASHDPGAWVEPAAAGTMRDWSAWQHKLVPLTRSGDGQISLRVNHAAGVRKWSIEERDPEFAERRRMSLAQVKAEWPPLDEVKDWTLDWPGDGRPHPRLFVSPSDLHEAWQRLEQDAEARQQGATLAKILAAESLRPVPSYKDAQAVEAYLVSRGDPQVAASVRLVERARQHLAALGDFDKMRHTQTVAALYDLLMSTDLVSPQEKQLFRSQMAFLGYILARPSTWDIERGYRSYNPNMSLSYLLARGIVACAIPDHPLAEEWIAPGLSRARRWLDEEVGPEGEWHESAHYSQVSAFALTSFAIAVQRAGFADLFENENLKKWAAWLAQIYTPRDPLPGRGNRRASPPIGRATAGVPWGLFGLMAKATAASDPAYSRQMQWAWAGTDYTTSTANHLGGFEPVYLDPTLPMEVPDWRSKLFPQVGPVFRNGVGAERENYLAVHAQTGAGARGSELGCLALWFARGVPIAGSFPGGYKERHQLLISRVIPALSWSQGQAWDEAQFGCKSDVRLDAFSGLPRQDYFAASYVHKDWDRGGYGAPDRLVSWPPVDGAAGDGAAALPVRWERRMLFVQDDDPQGANYLVLRDSVRGGKPSLWQMWTLSQKLGTAQEVQDLEQFLADAPGNEPRPARQLAGDHFTAVGQFDVDVEYFVASPTDTVRWTMRWGQRYVDYSVTGEDYRDLLQLRLAGDGEYFVAMFPRFRQEAAPQFDMLGEGTVIRVQGEFGTDYCFLPPKATEVQAGPAGFRGLAASVQDRPGDLVLASGGAGEVRYGEWVLSAAQACSLRIEPRRLLVQLPWDWRQAAEVTIRGPGQWQLSQPQPGVVMNAEPAGLRLALPAGVREVAVVIQP